MKLLQTKHGQNTGFFSHCSVRLHQIVRYLNKNRTLPDRITSLDQFHPYKDDPEVDITKLIFLDDDEMHIPYRHRVDFIHFKQFSNYKLLSFPDLLPLLKKYFTVTKLVACRERELIEQYGIDFTKTVGVRYRGNDKGTETSLPPYEVFFEKAQQLLAVEPDLRFLVQTDEQEFLVEFRGRFPNSFYFESLPPMPRDETTFIKPIGSHFLFGLEFLAAIHALSRCRYLIMGSGNAELWAVFFRGNAEDVYQFLNGRFVDRDNVRWGRVMVKVRRYFGKIGWIYRWVGRTFFGRRPE